MPADRPDMTRPPYGRGPSWFVVWLLVVAVALLAWRTLRPPSLLDPDAEPRVVTPRGDLSGSEQDVIALYERTSPSVVHINTVGLRSDLRRNVQRIPAGSGTGFLWDEQGYVVTNYHVIESAAQSETVIYVTLSGRETWTAEIVGYAPDHDLAVLLIKGRPEAGFRPLPLGTSADLRVGQQVFAIGNPFGLDQTLTTGVISGLDREILSLTEKPISGVIQTDAVINPGNSGGPLLDSAGRVIGVNTSIYSPSGANAGIGFAVPVDTVNRVVPQLIQSGRVDRPLIGFNPVPTASAVNILRVREGVVVGSVVPGSGAAAAGIRPLQRKESGAFAFDVIVRVAGRDIRDVNDIYRALDGREFGESVPVEVLREGERLTVDVELRRYEQ